MICLYSGTPGSGKSLHVIKDMVTYLRSGKNVISNFPINIDTLKPKNKKIPLGKFVYLCNEDLTVDFLIKFYKENHERRKEDQTLLVIDECQSLFNPRDFGRKDRRSYTKFFSLHRKLGYNCILVTQNDRLMDRQIRCLLEYEYKHRKVNNFGLMGMLIPFTVFCSVEYYYGLHLKLNSELFLYRRKYANLYDSYDLFDLDQVI